MLKRLNDTSKHQLCNIYVCSKIKTVITTLPNNYPNTNWPTPPNHFINHCNNVPKYLQRTHHCKQKPRRSWQHAGLATCHWILWSPSVRWAPPARERSWRPVHCLTPHHLRHTAAFWWQKEYDFSVNFLTCNLILCLLVLDLIVNC